MDDPEPVDCDTGGSINNNWNEGTKNNLTVENENLSSLGKIYYLKYTTYYLRAGLDFRHFF